MISFQLKVTGNLLMAMGMLLGLTGCDSSDKEQLQQWMSEQRALTKPQIDRLPEPSKFSPQAYAEGSSIEPFSNQKLTQALKRELDRSSTNSALITPELARRKESLEAYPLDTAVMVGSLNKSGYLVALLRIDNLLYQARVGNYLGQNYGRITKVTETGLTLREIVQDAAGEWIERTATLQLQEVSK